MSTPLSGFVRVIAKGPWCGQVGVISSVLWGNDQAAQYIDYPLVYVRIGNSKPLCFTPNELKHLDTTQAQSLLQGDKGK